MARVVLGEVVLHRLLLVVGALVDVAEATTGGELGRGHFGVLLGVSTGREEGTSRDGEVGAGSRKVRCIDVVILAQAAAGSGGAVASNARVTGGNHNRHTLHSQLHELMALAALVRDGQVALSSTVGNGNDVGRLVHATLKLALVAAVNVVRVCRVEVRVIFVALRAVRSINGVEKVVQETLVGVVLLVHGVVGLKQNRVLRPDERVRDLEVQVGFGTGLELALGGGLGTIDQAMDRVSASGNVTAIVSQAT